MRTPVFDLTDKVALVTGASRGIGRGIAKALAEAGADVAGLSRSASTETQTQVEAAGRRYLSLQADLATSTVADLNGLVDQTAAHFGRIDILVNNAGITCRKPALELTEEDWNTVLQVNLHAVFFLCQAAGRYFVPQGRGKIVNIASLMSFQGGVHIAPYVTSKHGVAGITRALATDWASARGQRQRDCARLHRYRHDRSFAAESRPCSRNQEPHSRRPLGHSRGHRQAGSVSRLRRVRLHARLNRAHRRRLAGAVGFAGLCRLSVAMALTSSRHSCKCQVIR